MNSILKLACASSVFILSALAAEPIFSGTWRLDPERSEIRAMPVAPARILKVDHVGTLIKCEAMANETEPSRPCSCTTDGSESRLKVGNRSLSTRSKWEGSALLRNTLVSGGESQHTEMDRWKLSRDGNTLTIKRVVVSLRGEMESTLIYQRDPN